MKHKVPAQKMLWNAEGSRIVHLHLGDYYIHIFAKYFFKDFYWEVKHASYGPWTLDLTLNHIIEGGWNAIWEIPQSQNPSWKILPKRNGCIWRQIIPIKTTPPRCHTDDLQILNEIYLQWY